MLLRLLKTNQAYHFILIPLMGILLWLPSFISPSFYPFYAGEDMMVLYKPIAFLIGENSFLSSLISLIIVILMAFFSIRLNVNYAFIRIRTFLPASILVLMISGLPALHTLHPVYFSALALYFAIDSIFSSYEKTKINTNAFDAGLFISIGSLFYLNLIFFFPMVWIGIIIIRKQINWRQIVLPIIGLAIPWIFTFSYYFYTDAIPDLLITLERNIIHDCNFLKGNIPLQVYFGFLALITLLGSFFLLSQYDEKKISTRKYFQVFFWLFFIALIVLIAVPSASHEIFVIMAISLSYLISNYLVFMERRFWGELIIWLFIAGIIYLQFI